MKDKRRGRDASGDSRDTGRERREPRKVAAGTTEGLTRRQERVSRRIREEVTERLREVDDRNLGFVTVTDCSVSPDLRHAKVGVSILGDDNVRAASLVILRRLLKQWRGGVGRSLGTRVVPELHVELDEKLERLDTIGQLIKEARASDPNPNPLTPEEAEALGLAAGGGLSPAVERLAGEVPQETRGRFLDDMDFDDDDLEDDDDEDDFYDDDDDDDEEDDYDDEDDDDDDELDEDDEDDDDRDRR